MLTDTLIYDRTAADVANRTAKGFYRASDTQRVRSAVATLKNRLVADGYKVGTIYPSDWNENDIPRAFKANRYIRAVHALHGKFAMPSVYRLPDSLDGLDYNGANEIERFLDDLDKCIDGYRAAWFYSDELFSGEADQ